MKLCQVGDVKAEFDALPAGFFSDAGCKPNEVSPVENSLQPADWNLKGKPSTSR
jgi:hypothetical protein